MYNTDKDRALLCGMKKKTLKKGEVWGRGRGDFDIFCSPFTHTWKEDGLRE